MYNDTLRRALAEDNDRLRAEIARLRTLLTETGQQAIEAAAENERLQEAKRRALAIADERSRENVWLRAILKNISADDATGKYGRWAREALEK